MTLQILGAGLQWARPDFLATDAVVEQLLPIKRLLYGFGFAGPFAKFFKVERLWFVIQPTQPALLTIGKAHEIHAGARVGGEKPVAVVLRKQTDGGLADDVVVTDQIVFGSEAGDRVSRLGTGDGEAQAKRKGGDAVTSVHTVTAASNGLPSSWARPS